jgi:hypothetical protein
VSVRLVRGHPSRLPLLRSRPRARSLRIAVAAWLLRFVDLRARLVPAPDRGQLPVSLLQRLGGHGPAPVAKLLAWLAPITTASCPDGSRLVRGVM